jgi:hypothetical protein
MWGDGWKDFKGAKGWGEETYIYIMLAERYEAKFLDSLDN